MHEFAPTKSRLSGDCPSNEELAAYIDGALDKEEAVRIAEHLVSCERCYEVYAETLRFQLDSESVSKQNIVPFTRKKEAHPATRWASIAALLLVGAGAGMYFQLLAPPPELKTLQVTTSLPNQPELAKQVWYGPRPRGAGGEEQEIRLDEASFRMGVQLVNLEVRLKAKDTEGAGDVVASILRLVQPRFFSHDLYNAYAAMRGSLGDPHKKPDQFLPEASRLAQEARKVFVDEESLDLGQWVEAGRLAALSHDPSFFRQSDARSFLRRSIWRSKVGLGETKLDLPTRQNLERIAGIVSKGDLQASDYASLQQPFDEILKIHYPDT
jgi:hypothetical protein